MDRRELLLNAALDIIGEEGLGGFTQPKVAGRAGMRQSHLTYYFATRNALLRAVADEAIRRRISSLHDAISADTPDQRLAILARVFADPAHTRIVVALVQSADHDPGIRDAFAALTREVTPVSRVLLTDFGVAPSAETLHLLQATSTGISVLGLAGGTADFEAQARKLLRHLLASLRRSHPLEERTNR